MDDYYIYTTLQIYKQEREKEKTKKKVFMNWGRKSCHEGCWPKTGRVSRVFNPGGDRREGSLVAVW